jgi:hypothetical protein
VLPSPNPRDPEPELDGISLDEPRSAAIFIIMRNRAMCSGDISALFYLYRVLQKYEISVGGEQVLQAQLKKEYGQPFQRLIEALESGTPPTPPEASTQDVDTAIRFLKQLGRFKQELADYVPGVEGKKMVPIGVQVNPFLVEFYSTSDSLIFSKVGPQKDLTVIVQWPEDATSPTVTVLPLVSSQPKTHPKKAINGQEPIGPNHSK